MRSFVVLTACTFALCAASTAKAVSTFDNRIIFMNMVGGVFEMEGFETPFPLENPHDFGPFTVTGAGDVDTSATVSQDTFYFTEGAASMYVKSDADLTASGFTSATFSFDSPITAFGIDIIGFGASNFFTGTLTVSNNGTLGATVIGDNTGGPLVPGNVMFFGVHDTVEFSNLTVTWTTRGDGLSFDNLKYQADNPIPEPGSMVLCFVGISIALLLTMRRWGKRVLRGCSARSLPRVSAVAVVAMGMLLGGTARAASYPWNSAQIQELADVTPAFHGGAGQLSTIDSIAAIPTGIQLEVTYRIGQDSDPLAPNYGLGFARVSLERCCFDAPGLDLSAFSGSTLKITTSTPITVQSFMYTDFTENGTTIDDGDAVPGEIFSELFWEHNDGLPAGGPTDVDFDFSNVTEFDANWGTFSPQTMQGADAVRGWGMQLAKFSGMTIGSPVQATITIESVVPEPHSALLMGVATASLVVLARSRNKKANTSVGRPNSI